MNSACWRNRGTIRCRWPLAVLLLILPTAGPTHALPESLGGSLRLVGVNTENQTAETQSLNQEYALRWSRAWAASLKTHASIRYDRYGADLSEGAQIWREELQPGGTLTWKHAWWSLASNYRYRKSTSNDQTTDLVRSQLGLLMRMQAHSYPTVSLGLELEQSYNRRDRASHDTRRTRGYGTASYSIGRSDLYYSASLLYGRNQAAQLKTTEGRHMVRWNQSAEFLQDKLRFGSSYNFSQRTQDVTLLESDTAMQILEPAAGLYAQNAIPELGELDTLLGLIDGDYESPTIPAIDIGQGSLDHNVGLDFGFPREIVALYIYTDRPSGPALRWTVYSSPDNITWDPLPQTPTALYNPAAFRYELTFDPIETRYIKMVNAGTNDVFTVLITELEAHEQITIDEERSRSQSAHQLNLSSTYDLTRQWQTTLDLDLRKEPQGDFTTGRDRANIGFSTRHTPNDWISQSVRLQTGWEKYQINRAADRNRSLAYTLLLKPLPTAGASFSAQTRHSAADGQSVQENNGVHSQGFAQVLPGLKLTVGTGYTRNNVLLSGQRLSTWSAHITADTRFTRSIEGTLSARYQTTRELGSGERTTRRRYTAGGTYAVTPALQLRGSLSLSLDNTRRYLVQDYGLSWTLSRKLSLSALAQTSLEDTVVRSRRRIASLNFAATRRTSLYASYVHTGADEDNQPEISSIQVGLTSGF